MKGNAKAQMEGILEGLLTEQLNLDPVRKSEEYRRLTRKNTSLQEKLSRQLNDEGKEDLNRLLDGEFEEWCCYSNERMVQGFRLGVLVMMEVFEGVQGFRKGAAGQ